MPDSKIHLHRAQASCFNVDLLRCSFDIEGAQTKYSEGAVCSESADLIKRLGEAGGVLVGRTVTEELNLG